MRKFSKTAIIGGLGVAVIGGAIFFVAQTTDDPAPKSAAESESASAQRSSRPSRRSADRPTMEIGSGNRSSSADSFGDSDWKKIAPTLTPAMAKQMLERDRIEEKNLEARAEKASRIINQLCRNGFTNEAWSLIEADPGIVREKSLNGFFRDANLPEAELITRLDGLAKKERFMGLSGYWERFQPEAFVDLDLGKFQLSAPEERAALRQTFESMLAKAFDPSDPEKGKGLRQDLLKFAVDQANAGVLVFSDIGKMLQKDPSKDGFAYWEALERVDPALRQGQDSLKGTDAQILRAMTAQDPERTLDMTLIDGNRARGKGYVALEKWLTQDYTKAEEWYHRNAGRADPDSSAVAFMRASATRGDYQTALDWYAKIKSESWQKGIGGEMRSIQRRLEAESNQ